MEGERLSLDEVAARAAVDPAVVRRLIALGVIAPDGDGGFGGGDARRVKLVAACEAAGLSAEAIAAALERGTLTLALLDEPYYDMWADRAPETYEQVAARLGIEVDLLCDVQVALGFPRPAPSDRPRTDEAAVYPLITVALQQMPRDAVMRLLSVYGTSLRRITVAETQSWHDYVEVPHQRRGATEREVLTAGVGFGSIVMPLMDRSLLAMYHRFQEGMWMADLVEHVETALEQAGVHERLERPPAMVFMDLSGYTALTEERGDEAAAELVGSLNDLVMRTAAPRGGQPVKFLGDGVMFHFTDPGQAVVASLELVEGTEASGLPSAHLGVHAGPVVQRDGDFYGRTVNWASRISGKAGPREVLVTADVVEHAAEAAVVFDPVGPTELKGVASPVELFRASRA